MQPKYVSTFIILVESGETRLMRMPSSTYDKILKAAMHLRRVTNQRERATRFRRRLRSIRATANRLLGTCKTSNNRPVQNPNWKIVRKM